MTEKWRYKFRAVTNTDFETEITVKANNKLFALILKKSLKAIQKRGIAVPEEIKTAENFTVDSCHVEPMYYKLLKNAFGKLFWQVAREVGKDGITPVNFEIIKCVYHKTDNAWDITAYMSGLYTKKEKVARWESV